MKNILEYLERTCSRLGDSADIKTAFSDDEGGLSFGELLTMARKGGSCLCARGLSGEPVPVFLPKKPDSVAAFLSVVYAGGIYVPLEEGMPLHRIRMILGKLKPNCIICDAASAQTAGELGYAEAVLDKSALFSAEENASLLAAVRSRALDIDPVYLVFTSGSTGVPKGVAACHRSLIDYAEALCPVIGSAEDSVFAMQVPLYVDACMKEILSVLRCGSEAVLMPQSLFMSPLRAVDFLNRHRVNTLCWVASALTMLSGLGAFEDACPLYLRTVCFGSEVFPVKQLHLWQQACPGAEFINLYGPTECTGMSFYYRVDRPFAEGERIPVGRPFDNTGYFLLKEDGTEALPGQEGEICIRGTCVTLGYYDDSERTAAAFIPNPLNTRWNETVYRTGDVGVVNARGELEFVSRRDNQIKNMGHRIELGEIEQCAMCCSGVENACCLWDAQRKKLVLFYMGSADPKQLSSGMKKELPRHMLPSKLTHLDALPMLANGKLDRRAMMDEYESSMKVRV